MGATHDAQRVLVVGDEPSLVDAVSTALRYEGFEGSRPPRAGPVWQRLKMRDPT